LALAWLLRCNTNQRSLLWRLTALPFRCRACFATGSANLTRTAHRHIIKHLQRNTVKVSKLDGERPHLAWVRRALTYNAQNLTGYSQVVMFVKIVVVVTIAVERTSAALMVAVESVAPKSKKSKFRTGRP
jgi:hypothetical protein